MKKFVKGILVLAVSLTTMTVFAQDKIITIEGLPNVAQDFIKKYYNVKDVALVEVEDELFSSKEYQVKLSDGTDLEFDSKGKWKEVDAELQGVPQEIVPGNIREYVNKSFPNNKIVQISRSSRKYEVELTNGIDLDFDQKGNFIRIDD